MPRLATSRLITVLLLTLVVAAGALRWTLGVSGPSLWLDEAWTVLIAQGCNGDIRAVFSEPNRVDNNHPLVTLLVVLLGAFRDGSTYRGAILIIALPLPLLAYALARRLCRSPDPHATRTPSHVAAIAAAVFAALSFPLTVYCTEVRGYGPAMVAALGAWLLYTVSAEKRWAIPAYWLCCLLGILSHVTFLQALGGLIVAQLLTRQPLRQIAALQGVPLLLAGLVSATFYSQMKIAGAGGIESSGNPALDTLTSLLGAFSLFAGGPASGPGAILIGSGALLLAAAIAAVYRAEGGLVVLGALATALLMVLVRSAVFGQSEVIFLRYFLVSALLACFFALLRLALLIRRTRPLDIAIGAVGLGALAGNLQQTWRFATSGARGEYLAPLQVVASSPEPTLSSDYDSRTLRLENFYRPRLPARISYQRSPASPTALPRWHLAGTGIPFTPEPRITLAGTPYRLRNTYPHHGPSGWTWHLYERE